MMKNIDLDSLIDYFKGHPDIRFALLYGSLAKGKANPLSDLDVAVFFQNGLTREHLGDRQIEITCDLMNRFRINRVDVTILNLASPFSRFQVIKYGQLLKCIDKNEFFLFKSRVLGEYQDIKPMYDLYARSAINKMLTSLNENIKHLESKKNITFEEYQNNRDIQAIVERKLETSIQACIDIGNHLISQENMGTPDHYGEIFIILGQHNVIPQDSVDTMVKMAGFRNILVHEYRELLNERVYKFLQSGLKDFYVFARAIIKYIS
jgi:uncharacterized protein YutE (UPF0331/DUF86 family)/predicted nucleotidyltransferase